MNKEFFEQIEQMKKGKKKDISNPLLLLAQRILKSRPAEARINQRHKAGLKQRLEQELKPAAAEPGPSFVLVLKTMFSLRPQNLMAYGSLITIIALALILTTNELSPLPKQAPVFEGVRLEREMAVEQTREEAEQATRKNKTFLLVIAALGILIIGVGSKGLLAKK